MEVVAKKWLLLGAVVLSSVGAQKAYATIYTIPGTAVQIAVSSTSTDPQYQFTSSEIALLLAALARYPVSQLQELQYVQAQPYGSNPSNPTAGSASGPGYIIFLSPELEHSSNEPN